MFFGDDSLDAKRFLADYWQKKPLLLREAFPGFVPELDADDIAGLACEELAESRLVSGSFPEHDWNIRYGPFDEAEFSDLPERDWTLLVQDVEKHHPPLQGLMARFDFLPRWRIDDLMVSVAAPGGSVGPHVDQYDVFLLQAAGSRRWEIADSFDDELLADCELKVLRAFNAGRSWTLQPGDMLYLPPGIAHHGVALDEGMTWSIGMRAPSAADLFQAWGEWQAVHGDEGGRYRDPGLRPATRPGEIDRPAIGKLRAFAQSGGAEAGDFESFLGSFLSRYRLAHEPAPPDDPVGVTDLLAALEKGDRLRHNPWSRLLWISNGDTARVFAAGEPYDCDSGAARILCDPVCLERLGPGLSKPLSELICSLLNRGHLYLERL